MHPPPLCLLVVAIAPIPCRLCRESPPPGASTHSTHPLTRHLWDARGYIRCFGTMDNPVVRAGGPHCRYLTLVATHPWLRASDPGSRGEVLRFLPFYDIAHPTE